jgi:hypothetical protein
MRTPQEGGIMNGGPLNGRIMAYGGPVMPAIVDGERVGSYIWDEDHWEYEKDDGRVELFAGGYDE